MAGVPGLSRRWSLPRTKRTFTGVLCQFHAQRTSRKATSIDSEILNRRENHFRSFNLNGVTIRTAILTPIQDSLRSMNEFMAAHFLDEDHYKRLDKRTRYETIHCPPALRVVHGMLSIPPCASVLTLSLPNPRVRSMEYREYDDNRRCLFVVLLSLTKSMLSLIV